MSEYDDDDVDEEEVPTDPLGVKSTLLFLYTAQAITQNSHSRCRCTLESGMKKDGDMEGGQQCCPTKIHSLANITRVTAMAMASIPGLMDVRMRVDILLFIYISLHILFF
jgi:hypothetical protein